MNDIKLAVTYDDETGEIFQHFGHCRNFKIYHLVDNEVTTTSVVSSGTYGHGGLATFLQNMGVSVLICGGIGGGAQNALKAADIKLYGGVQGLADQAVAAFLKEDLIFNPDVHCDHHHHGDGHEHNCGGHNHEGGHNCGHHGEDQ